MRSAAYDERPWLRFYPQGVPDGVIVPALPVNEVLEQAAADFGRTVAMAFLGRATTYRRLLEQVGLLAGSLTELGIGPGDRVALVLPNCPQFVIAFFAVVRIGAIAVPLDPDLEPSALRERVTDSGARTVIAIDRAYRGLAPLRRDGPGQAGVGQDGVDQDGGVREIVLTSLRDFAGSRARLSALVPLRRYRDLRAALAVTPSGGRSVLSFNELVEGSPGAVPPAEVAADRDLAVLLYTAGTTGPARGAMLTHRNLIAAVCQNAVWDRFMERGSEATLLSVPMHTPHGLTVGLLSTVFAAGTLVLLPVDAPDLMVHCARDWTPSMFPAGPDMYRALVAWHHRDTARRCLRSVRTSLSFGQPLAEDIAAQLRKETGIRATEAYGLAETSGVALANPLNANARPGTAGLPLPGTDARIVDEHDPNDVLPIGTAGELALRGPQVCGGYWGRSREDASLMANGWLVTGDIAVMSPDGYVTILDRKSDLIVTSGFVVFPSEIEWAARQHEGVAGCAAVGVPDGLAGQAITLCVVPEPGAVVGADAVRETCARFLPPYMIPRDVQLVSALPRTRNGSVMRRELRREYPAGA